MASSIRPQTDRNTVSVTGIGTWEIRLARIVDMMRGMSQHTDPQKMVSDYGERLKKIMPMDCQVSLSRRGLEEPAVRITRFSGWEQDVNPWEQADALPVLSKGLFSDLIYRDEPTIIDELKLDADDPAAPYLEGQRSLCVLPLFDEGVSRNMVVIGRNKPNAFERDGLPELVWMSNLFGKATHALVMSQQLKTAYEAVDYEMQVVADIQRSLLPAALPAIPTMDLAAYYRTSSRAGGDYYDFIELPDGRWGILIADVSGHGTPAAVIMAVVHSIARLYPGPPTDPSAFLSFINSQLLKHYTGSNGTFVTAFYGVYDPRTREIHYASAGHDPPRVKHCGDGTMSELGGAFGLPLGIADGDGFEYSDQRRTLRPLDQIIFYTDGITEAHGPGGDLFGIERLDRVLYGCRHRANELIEDVLTAVDGFTHGAPPTDDRTMLIAKIS